MNQLSRIFGAVTTSAVLIVLSACTSAPVKPSTPDPTAVALDNMLAKAAHQPSFTGSADEHAPAPRMANGKLWVSWQGDAVNLLRKLAPLTGLAVSVTGPVPRLPLYVQVHADGLPLDEVLRDIGYQLGQRADLILQAKSVEIRYRAY
ncbi:MAG: hypothetical protein EPN79_11245 [Burkholderiaceae bacterium]|nr:MAG: hypothetical protein EPN79_11245 [Burkholderiaceae bacterium]TBR76742.1 MAG: hypothetical protein EPN64_05830 [Burkholderiaceae bacterium]